MSRSGRIVLSVVGAVVVITGATLAVTRPWADASTATADQHGFVRYANAVAFPPPYKGTESGAMLGLIPYGQCAMGLGEVEDASTQPTYWSGGGDCEHLGMNGSGTGEAEPDSGPASSHPGGSLLTGGVVTADGSVIAVGEDQEHNDYNASSGQVYSIGSGMNLVTELDSPQNADKQWQDKNGQVMFNAIAQVGTTLLVGGRQSSPTSEGRPTIWSSTDGGRTLTPIDLPAPASLVAGVDAMAVHGDTVLALGNATADEQHDTLIGWLSTDQGRTWSDIGRQSFAASSISGIVFANGRWFAAGDTEGAKMPEPVLLTSSDARHWQVTSLPAPQGGGSVTGLTVDRTGTPIVVGWTGGPPSGQDATTTECGAIWLTTPPATWTDAATGCGGPTPTGVVTLADGRVLVASDHDLWIRGVGNRG
ncbi:MAG TPA: hypothetical protein VHZ97_05820 [Pseudonocardiaceae bacterium]|nr:hypothetical protein [Pseudonocardiaceae bacterium]